MGNRVIVVNLNPAVDKTFILKDFLLGKTNIAKSMTTNIGGKGINVALSLKNLSVGFLLTGILGGNNGAYLKNELKKRNINFEFMEVPQETRINHKIYSENTRITTEINERGEALSQFDFLRYMDFLTNKLDGCEILALSGSIPTGFPKDTYFKIIEVAKKRDIKVILDTSGQSLSNSISALPYVIKPNKEELETYSNRKLDSIKAVAEEMLNISKIGIGFVVTSLGKEGAIAINKGRILKASSYEIEPLSTVGAGDSMIAAMIYCFINKIEFEMMLRWMITFSTISSTYGAGLFSSLKEAQNSLEKIKIKEICLNDLHYM